ncbi:MAG: alpha/beta hydrolase [Candidatus Lokiarchaeota archaeon]|nr:alpha/beta hydrolase [Candidatus Lokiarchaeota archaeon]
MILKIILLLFYFNLKYRMIMEERFANVNGLKVCYRVDGDGYPLILIHGFGSKKESFMAQVPTLSQKFKVLTYDARGAGKTERPNNPYSMDMFADDLKALMDYLKFKKAHLLGLSMGGMIALTFTIKYPSMVNKLILINTLAKFPEDFDPEAYIQSRIKSIELMKQMPEKSFWDSTQFGFYPKFRRKMKENPNLKFYGLWSVQDLIEYYKTDSPTPQDIRNLAASFKTYYAYDRINEIKHRALLLTASHDKLVPKEKMIELHKIMANSIIEVIEKAGHESAKEKAPEVNEYIINFLEN